jgi:WD40 repeat protein
LSGKIKYEKNLKNGTDNDFWGFSSLAFSRDGKILASSDFFSGTIRLWFLDEDRIKPIRAHFREVNGVSFHPHSDYLVTASYDNTAKVWDYEGDLVETLEGHIDSVDTALFSRDGSMVITASDDTTIRFWNWVNGTTIETLASSDSMFFDLAISSEEDLLVASSNGGAVIWSFNLKSLLKEGCEFLKDYTQNPDIPAEDAELCGR